jgi:hypothetical protein
VSLFLMGMVVALAFLKAGRLVRKILRRRAMRRHWRATVPASFMENAQ